MVHVDVTSLEPGENSEDNWEDESISSRSSDSDDEEDYETQERHEDHWDTIYFTNPWSDEWTADWLNNWVERGERSATNEDLYKNATTQQWMKAFTSMRRNRISPLTRPRLSGKCTIPLFQDGNGWQYQVRLIIADIPLPVIRCPSTLPGSQSCSSSLFSLVRRIQIEPGLAAEDAPTPPKLAVPLGKLIIRNNARGAGSPRSYLTEYTDWSVVVDVEHEDMPLWLLAPRAQLQKRLDNPSYPIEPLRNLPIFDGLLQKEDDCEYDCACILSSLHRLGKSPPDPDAPSFQEACEMMRKTRATVDPAAILLPKERIQDFIGDEPLPDPFQRIPYSEVGSQEEETESKEGAEKKEQTERKEDTKEGGEESATKPDEVDAQGK